MDVDADKLNRELQIFRNHVKIARENIIHKLVRDIKFWKTKHESNSENTRASKKLVSLEPLIVHIKAQTASELAKAIIRFQPNKAGGTTTSNVAERALMRFHGNKKLQPETRALIRRFALKDKMDVLDKYLKDPGAGKGSKSKVKKKKDSKIKIKTTEQDSEDQGFCETKNDDTIEPDSEASDTEATGSFVRITPGKVGTAEYNTDQKQMKTREKKKKVKTPKEPTDEENCMQIQDSFFVTSTGHSYVATAPVVDQKRLEKEEQEFSWKRANKRKDILGNRIDDESKRPFVGKVDDLHPSWKAKQSQKGIRQFEGSRKRFDETAENTSIGQPHNQRQGMDLHPSWAAKQKQKTLQPFFLQPFAGKKIKFDSETQDQIEKTSASKESLHPSWAAKQAQKGIKPFAGKRITFDSSGSADTRLNTAPKASEPLPSADLHPSWAAKQKEKGIKEFRGKKITFGDD
ncbi:uncharacterized protein LOC131428606 [Malaya genurostris]|uniref:uncharacterized protein LOC131428606 n=1 Tax=Malaya genurostris TaxID=325434 RepID=UPI0026F3DACE|nr:uncharacterized protein LOC131428606 [Malaya genurostris]